MQGIEPKRQAQIVLAWMMHRRGVTAPIIGASKMCQLEEAVAALDITLALDEVARLEEPRVRHPVLGQ